MRNNVVTIATTATLIASQLAVAAMPQATTLPYPNPGVPQIQPPRPGGPQIQPPRPGGPQIVPIGRAQVCTPVTNAHLVCRLLLETKKYTLSILTSHMITTIYDYFSLHTTYNIK